MDDVLINFGGAVKSLGENRIGGYLVMFGDATKTDLVKDFFTPDTNFDIENGETRTGYFNHGLDVTFRNTKIGRGTLTTDENGVYLEAELKVYDADKWKAEKKAERQAYIDSVMELVRDGECGLSSGAVSHLVRREKTGNAFKMLDWPIGEWSITHTPAEPRTQVMAVKTWQEQSVSFEDMKTKRTAEQLAADPISTELPDDNEETPEEANTRRMLAELESLPLKSLLPMMRRVAGVFDKRVTFFLEESASAKSGRAISAANATDLDEICTGMETHVSRLRGMVDRHKADSESPKSTTSAMDSLYMNFLHATAPLQR